MGLRESRIINSVHPWLGERLKWLQEVAVAIGSTQTLISGNRTIEEQRELWEGAGSRPVAAPGCSQHQYGFAADATWTPAVHFGAGMKPKTFSTAETFASMESAARFVNLTTVSGDPGHMQMYPGSQFRQWAVGLGLCTPTPRPSSFARESAANTERYQNCLKNVSGAFNTILRDVQVSACFKAWSSKNLALNAEEFDFKVTGTF